MAYVENLNFYFFSIHICTQTYCTHTELKIKALKRGKGQHTINIESQELTTDNIITGVGLFLANALILT